MCPICNQNSKTSSSNRYNKCNYCGLLIAKYLPREKQVQTILEDQATGIIQSHHEKKTENKYQKKFTRITKFVKNPYLVLDFGCGNGTFVQFLRSKGYQSYGYDKSKTIQRYLDLQNIPQYKRLQDVPDHSFDVVTCSDVIEHIPYPRLLIRQIKQKLQNNAILILGTPNAYGFSSSILRQKWWVFGPAAHFVLFSSKSIKILLESEGFEVLDISTDNITPWFISTNRPLYKILNKLVYLSTLSFRKILFTWMLGDNIQIIARYVNKTKQ